MYVVIRNMAGYPLICPLNNGQAIHLAPAQVSPPLDRSEIDGNAKIEKLARSRLIAITPSGDPAAVESQSGGAEPAAATEAAAAVPDRVLPPEPIAATPAPADASGKASLSRLQFLVFTFVVAGLFLVLSIRAGSLVDVPAGVLGLLGVSAGSFLASRAIN